MSSLLPPEGQPKGSCPAPRSAGLGSPLARRPQELVLPPHPTPARPREEAGAPHTVPEAGPCGPGTIHIPGRLELSSQAFLEELFSWAPTVSGANTGMHILLYVLCFLFLDTFDFFT